MADAFGTLEEGKTADVFLVDGESVANISVPEDRSSSITIVNKVS